MTIWFLRFECWVTVATNTPSVYVIPIVCPRQQWLHERASMLRYTYIACLLNNKKDYVNCFISDFKTYHLAVSRYKNIDQSPSP